MEEANWSVGRVAKRCGVKVSTLPDSRTPTVADRETLSTHWRNELNARIAYLERLRDSLTGCIGCGCLSLRNCPIYNENDKLATQGSGPVILDCH